MDEKTSPNGGATILVVNDDPVQLAATRAYLEAEGYSVLACTNAEQALRILDASLDVALLVTDLHMPGIDGLHLCWLLRSPEYERFNAIPILAVSAEYTESEAKGIAREMGADVFLPAPLDRQVLARKVRSLLSTPRPRGPMRILGVLDRPEQGAELRALLGGDAYTFQSTSSLGRARMVAREMKPALILIDDAILVRDGEAAMEELKQVKRPPVIVVFAAPREEFRAVHVLHSGADAYIEEPHDVEELMEVYRRALRTRSLSRAKSYVDRH